MQSFIIDLFLIQYKVMFLYNVFKYKINMLYAGRVCKMLRDHRCGNRRRLRRQDRIQEADDQTQSEGEDRPGDNYSPQP